MGVRSFPVAPCGVLHHESSPVNFGRVFFEVGDEGLLGGIQYWLNALVDLILPSFKSFRGLLQSLGQSQEKQVDDLNIHGGSILPGQIFHDLVKFLWKPQSEVVEFETVLFFSHIDNIGNISKLRKISLTSDITAITITDITSGAWESLMKILKLQEQIREAKKALASEAHKVLVEAGFDASFEAGTDTASHGVYLFVTGKKAKKGRVKA